MKVRPLFKHDTGIIIGYRFQCPGCEHSHSVNVNNPESKANWTFNGNVDDPTFSPSVLVRTGHYIDGKKYGDGCWCKYHEEHPEKEVSFKCGICHSFIRDGKIQFLSDCTHHLAGKTVDLPDIQDL